MPAAARRELLLVCLFLTARTSVRCTGQASVSSVHRAGDEQVLFLDESFKGFLYEVLSRGLKETTHLKT